jgi:membrane-associated phospholipid phosphatase
MRARRFILAFSLLLATNPVWAKKSNFEVTGDVLQVLVPLSGYAATFYLDDTEGRNQFYKSFLSTFLITHTLKIAVKEKRPNNNGNQSFPSGHTSSAFQGAAFIQKRYGWKYGLPAYAAATLVGYSRVEDESQKHYNSDVVVGAAIGILSSYYFTTPYKNTSVVPYVGRGSIDINLSMRW